MKILTLLIFLVVIMLTNGCVVEKGKIVGDTLKFYDDDDIHHFTYSSFTRQDPASFWYIKSATPHWLREPDF